MFQITKRIFEKIKNNKFLIFISVLVSVYFIYQAGIRFGEFIYYVFKK